MKPQTVKPQTVKPQTVKPKRTKTAPPAAPQPVECSTTDRASLTDAYKAGRIVAWKLDGERYRLTFADRRDEYVEVAKLPRYLEKLGAAS